VIGMYVATAVIVPIIARTARRSWKPAAAPTPVTAGR
jgi:hypothetical protein